MSLAQQQYELAQMRHNELMAEAERRRLATGLPPTEPNQQSHQPISLRLNRLVITVSFDGKAGGIYETC